MGIIDIVRSMMRNYELREEATTTGGRCFVAWFSDMPDCVAQGSTPDEAVATLRLIAPPFAAAAAEHDRMLIGSRTAGTASFVIALPRYEGRSQTAAVRSRR